MPGNSADNSAILSLPYIQPSQAQKHVTHNEALSTLDVLVQLSVAGFDATTPPVDPAPGEVHALGAAPTGAWAGQGNTLATWRDGAWVFIAPLAGWRAWGVGEAELRIWDGTAWGLPPAGMDNLAGVGINTTADATNRLSVSAPATLLSHEGAGHQLKINKAGDTDTASLLFQSGWTGHAEMGLSGATDFAIKVSADGVLWTEALAFDGTSGTVGGAAVQSSATDATAGRLMTVGAFGLGLTNDAADIPGGNDLDTVTTQGFWRYKSDTASAPSTAGMVLHFTRLAGAYSQLAISDAGKMYSRNHVSGTWSGWAESVNMDTNGDLDIDAGTFFVDTSANRVGVGTVTPAEAVDVDGRVQANDFFAKSTAPKVDLIKTNDATTHQRTRLLRGANTFKIATRNDGGSSVSTDYEMTVDSAGATAHIWSIGGAEKARINSSGNMGVGTSNPTRKLNVREATDNISVLFEGTNAALTNRILDIRATRAGSSAFEFARWSSGGSTDPEFRFSGDGNGTCDGSWTGGGADYAEYFEWADGNPEAEDRRGISVVLVGDQIREAVAGEDPIGVISGNPSVVGDAAAFRWKGKYLRDDFGSPVMEDYEVVSWVETVTEPDEDGESVTREVTHSYAVDAVPDGLAVPGNAVRVTQSRRKLSPGYDPAYAYTPRAQRPEWDTVGLMGKLRLRKGQVTGAGWVKMRDVSDSVEEWLVR